ncbi:MAG: imidazole glycerol phosphate synthase subunit HisF [Phycisphaerales bacterium]|nr:imidazole glycerol phosphate synthase subunit HisF [Phycisphaerales bacterium]
MLSTGTANVASVLAALSRLGAAAQFAADAREVEFAERLVLPGVGTFGAAMEGLHARGLVEPLRRRLAARRPTLCICLGLQLLGRASEESPGVAGLGILPVSVTRFGDGGRGPERLRVPQLGWNRVQAEDGCRVLRAGSAYFANSFRIDASGQGEQALRSAGWRSAATEYGGRFVSAVECENGRVVACQFHPELSGPWGLGLIRRWLEGGPPGDDRAGAGLGSGLMTRIIPCLDVNAGRVVKGVRFTNLRDAGDPAELAAAYEAQGADELVILDVSATPEGRANAAETVRAVRRVLSIPLTVGGGVRAAEDAGRLLDAGADKVGVNTAAVERPELIAEIASRFGAQCAVLALDAARNTDGAGWRVVTRSGTRHTTLDAAAWAARAAALGAGEILLTSFDRDGTRSGYDLDLLQAVSAAAGVPVIASGGADSAGHMLAALRAGASAVLAASIFHDGVHTVGALKNELAAQGVAVRRTGEEGAER